MYLCFRKSYANKKVSGDLGNKNRIHHLMVDDGSATIKKRCREEILELEEAEKEQALIEAALFPAKRPSFHRLSSDPTPYDTCFVQGRRPRSLEEAMQAHTVKLQLEQMQREEDERLAMAEDMKKIAELEKQAEEIESAAKAAEAQRIEQLERQAYAFERAAHAFENMETPKTNNDVSFAVGPGWNSPPPHPTPPPRRAPRPPPHISRFSWLVATRDR